jgi:hypothetical protein
MANLKSDLIAALDQINISDKVVDGDRTGGIVLLATAIVQLDASLVAGNTIQLLDLPAGAVIVPQLCSVTPSANPATTLTLDVGDSGDADRYADGIVLNGVGQVMFSSAAPYPAAVTVPFRPTASTRIYATVVSAAAVGSVKLAFAIAYRVKG